MITVAGTVTEAKIDTSSLHDEGLDSEDEGLDSEVKTAKSESKPSSSAPTPASEYEKWDQELLACRLSASQKGMSADIMAKFDKIANRHGKKLSKVLIKFNEDIIDGNEQFDRFVLLVSERLHSLAKKADVRADISNLHKMMQMELAVLSDAANRPLATEGQGPMINSAQQEERDRKFEKITRDEIKSENMLLIKALQERVEALERQCDSQKLAIEELSHKSVCTCSYKCTHVVPRDFFRLSDIF